MFNNKIGVIRNYDVIKENKIQPRSYLDEIQRRAKKAVGLKNTPLKISPERYEDISEMLRAKELNRIYNKHGRVKNQLLRRYEKQNLIDPLYPNINSDYDNYIHSTIKNEGKKQSEKLANEYGLRYLMSNTHIPEDNIRHDIASYLREKPTPINPNVMDYARPHIPELTNTESFYMEGKDLVDAKD
jgi:hypothetical protein